MKIKTKKDWWRGFFNEIYLITDARSVCNEALTQREVKLVERLLGLDKNSRILDLCGGQGRHSLELAKRGYKDLTVLDFSGFLVRLGRKTAKKKGLKVKFLLRDARATRLKSDDYSVVFIMANSFGYFSNENDNMRVLREIRRLLKKGGKLLLDLSDPDYVRKNLKPISWHEANKDIIVCRKREFKNDLVKTREIVISKRDGILRDGFYCARLYKKNRIINFLQKTGFKNISVKRNLSLHKNNKDYGFLTSRMFVTAVKKTRGCP